MAVIFEDLNAISNFRTKIFAQDEEIMKYHIKELEKDLLKSL